jgi:hypothetical protein
MAFQHQWSARQAKSRCRKLATSLKPGQTINTALVLPSNEQLDVKQLHANGHLTTTSKVIAVESQVNIAQGIRSYFAMTQQRYSLRQQQLDKVKINEKIDYAFIDLCGWLTPKRYTWIQNELIPNLDDYGRVAFTFQFVRYPKHTAWLRSKNQYVYDINHYNIDVISKNASWNTLPIKTRCNFHDTLAILDHSFKHTNYTLTYRYAYNDDKAWMQYIQFDSVDPFDRLTQGIQNVS